MNIALLSLLVLTVATWVIVYGDLPSFFGPIFGVGGLATWVGAGSKILKPARKEHLRTLFDRFILQGRYSSIVIICVLVSVVVLFSGYASITIHSHESTVHRGIRFNAYTVNGKFDVSVESGKSIKKTVWAGWLGRDITVKPHGLPRRVVNVRGLERITLHLPNDFRARHGVLIQAAPTVAEYFEDWNLKLAICVDDERRVTLEPGQYQGKPFWIGVQHDVEIPSGLATRGDELTISPPDADFDLALGQTVSASLWSEGESVGFPVAKGEVTISEYAAYGRYAHLLVLFRHGKPEGAPFCGQ